MVIDINTEPLGGATGRHGRRDTDDNGTSNEHDIRRLVEDWAAAVRARDVEGAVPHDADDIVMFDVPLPLQSRGMEEDRKTWALLLRQ